MKTRRIIGDVVVYLILIIMSVIWLAPIVWLVLQSFSGEGGSSSMARFAPIEWTGKNYLGLFTNQYLGTDLKMHDSIYVIFYNAKTGTMGSFLNTLIVAFFTMIFSTALTLATSYALSRLRFKGRKLIMKTVLLMGMFPGFLGLIILYWMFKLLSFPVSIWELVFCYSAGSGAGYYISKGFFDTVSKQIDEAAMIDGASRFQIFYKITLPLSKPIIVYTALTSFMGPWAEYITASYLLGDHKESYTVAYQLNQMIGRETLSKYWGTFCAAAVLIAVPTSVLFIALQKYYVSGVTGGAVKG